MARESHRPTKTNYQDYLFDFSNVDFSQYAGQGSAQGPDVAAQQTDEPGFLARLGNTALAIGEGLTMLPGGIVGTVRDTWHGGDIDVTDTEAMRDREERARQQAAYVQKYQGKAFDGVADAMISMPYSLATMGASLGAGIPATMAAGPVVGGATGMAASGAVAYRASKQNFMENMLAETTKLLGRTPTQDEWDRVAQEFDSEATQYGLWEAGPEALSNLFMTKLLGPLGKRVFSGGIGNAAKRVAGLYGEEMATETATQMGQGSIEADLGLRDEAPGVLQALGEVAPATFWQTTLMAGGKKGLDLLSRRYDRGQQVEEAPAPDQQEGSQNRPEAPAAGPNNTAPASDFGSLSGPEWNAPEARIDEAMWNREASARGWNHLRTDAPKPDPAFIPGDPFTDPAAAQDTEDFVRRFEEAEQAVEEDTTGMAQSLDQGKTVDLLATPPQQEDSPAPGRPSAPVKSAPAVHAPAPGPDIPRQTSPLLSPRSDNGIHAQPNQQGMAAPAFPVGPSPLPAGGVLSQMGQAGPQRQPPVTAVPTQAQVLNIQATPRADTTAPAEALGMPAPDAIPREAQPAPQAGDMAAPSAMPAQQPVARPVVPMPEMTPMDAPRQEAPDASPRREEKPASVQAAPEVTAPLMYRGAPISRMPIGDDRRENQADSILQAAEQKAKAAGDARMQAAVAEIQQERKYVGVTHDALWERINSDILPYAAGDAHDATQQPSPQDDFLREHLVVATITGPAGSPTPPQSEGIPEKRQKSGTSSVAEQRKAILQSLPEDLRKAHKGAPLSKLKELAAQHGRNEESSPEDQLAANGTSYGTVDKPDTIALAHHFSAAFLTGRKFGTIVEARREAASLLGGAVRPATETAKAVDEAIELGVTLAARKTVAEMRERRENDTAIYRALVDLYQRQPRLSVRTSTSMAQQAYSTPAPIAFLASRLAGIDTGTKVFEPTAGNGMLLMEAAPKNTTANELNADRAERLRSQGFTVSEHDAVDYAPSGMDVVIANPPFGRVKDAGRQTKEFSANGLTTKELDHAIVARALSSLKKDGRAVLIIGGKKGDDDSRSKKYRAADQVSFWGWLFDHYRVLDHFSVDGKLYERQGAGYPIDIVVLENSGPSRGRVFPGAALPRHYTSFGDLEEVLHGQVVDSAERTPGTDGPDTGRVGDGPDSQSGRADRAADAEIADADRGRVRSGRDAGTDGARSGERLDPRVRDDRSAETGGGRILGSERPAGESGNDFCENDGGIYRWTECQEDGVRFEHPGIYTDYAKCRNRISREISDNEDGEIASYLVTKTYPDAEEPCIQSELSAAGKLFSIRESQAGPDPFEGLFFVFPTPFQKGDIVWEPNTQGYCKGPFVLTGVSGEAEASGHRRGGDNSDMTAWGYFQDESENIYHETMWNYMDLEYYRGPLTGKRRVLRALSSCLKGEIDEGLFARAYHAILTEEYAGSLVPRDITKEGMTLAALREPEPVRLWLDDLRKAPPGYKWCTSVNAAIRCIELCEKAGCTIELIDCDHDLGDYAEDGGDGIKLIDWLAERKSFYRIKLHTMNPVGRENMQREIERYWPSRREKER